MNGHYLFYLTIPWSSMDGMDNTVFFRAHHENKSNDSGVIEDVDFQYFRTLYILSRFVQAADGAESPTLGLLFSAKNLVADQVGLMEFVQSRYHDLFFLNFHFEYPFANFAGFVDSGLLVTQFCFG